MKNIYQFNKIIYKGNIDRDFFLFCCKKNKKLYIYILIHILISLLSLISLKAEIAKKKNASMTQIALAWQFAKGGASQIIGVTKEKYLDDAEKVELPEEILKLVEERKKARENKDWALSDKIRDELKEKGYIVKDTKEGMSIEKEIN